MQNRPTLNQYETSIWNHYQDLAREREYTYGTPLPVRLRDHLLHAAIAGMTVTEAVEIWEFVKAIDHKRLTLDSERQKQAQEQAKKSKGR